MSSKIVTKDNFVHWAIENGGLYGVSVRLPKAGRISQNLTQYTIPLLSLTICYSLVTGSLYGCSQNEVKTFTEKILSLINSSLPGKAILQDSAMSCHPFSQCNKQFLWPAAKTFLNVITFIYVWNGMALSMWDSTPLWLRNSRKGAFS